MAFTAGVALLLAMGNLFYRDVKYLFEVVITVWMFATSVVYPVESVGGRLGQLLALNPMTPIIEAYRAVLLYGQLPPAGPFAATAVAVDPRAVRRLADLPPRRVHVRGEHLMSRPAVVFDGVWKKFRRGERHDSLRDLIPGSVGAAARPVAAGRDELTRQGVLGGSRRVVRGRPGRGARHHRPERRRQVDDPEAADPDSPADPRHAAKCAAAPAR